MDNPYEFNIDNNKLVDIEKQKALIDLSYYAINNIANYRTVTEIPQENIEYLSSGLSASSCDYMFMYCRQLTSIPWNEFNIDTSQCTDMEYMFSDCNTLTSLDLSNIDTSQITYMRYMFYECNSLTNLDLSNFDTSKVIDMDFMFDGCKSLQKITCPNGFDLSSCKYIDWLFNNCNSYNGEPLHFKNVPRDLNFSGIHGIEGTHYVIDSYKS